MAKILVIEESLEIRQLLKELLEMEGHDILVAGNGLDGLTVADKELPELIIYDINMPQGNGLDVLERLKTEPATQEIPVIALTALADSFGQSKCLEMGVVNLSMPFSRDQLLRAIAQVL